MADAILPVAEIVAGIGQQFDKRDIEIGDVPLLPLRVGDGQPVEQQLAKGVVILGQIVNDG